MSEPQHFPVRKLDRNAPSGRMLTDHERAERGCGGTIVYRFYDASQRPLYFGMSTNGTLRWDDHRKTASWWHLAEYVAVSFYGGWKAGLTAEAAAIRSERPSCNRQGLRPRKQTVIRFEDGAEAIAAELHRIADPDLVRQLAELLAAPERFPGPTPPPAPVFPARE